MTLFRSRETPAGPPDSAIGAALGRLFGRRWAAAEGDALPPSIYGFILRYSLREQVYLVVVTLLSFPFLYYSLELPKVIINQAIGGKDFPWEVLGIEFHRISYLVLLCSVFLVLVLINGWFKYHLNVRKGRVGERMLRRLRYDLFQRLLRFPMHHFDRTATGEIIAMLTAELEPVGRGAAMGALGRVYANGDLDLALTIRTFAITVDAIHLWVGGGIVWDSQPEAEIEESWVKARPLLAAETPVLQRELERDLDRGRARIRVEDPGQSRRRDRGIDDLVRELVEGRVDRQARGHPVHALEELLALAREQELGEE